MRNLLIYTLLTLTTPVFCQEILTIGDIPCSIQGNAQRVNDRLLNIYKNRYTYPTPNDIDPDFNWTELAKPGDDRDQYNNNNAAVLRGYVFAVKMSEPETCNCKSKDPNFRDTHIILTPNASEAGIATQVIVEVTPRLRAMMASKGVDWSQTALKNLKGQFIEVTGWLFYDYKHGDKSAKIEKEETATRSTAWEIHPITSIKIIK